MGNRPYAYPSQADVAAYGASLRSGGRAPLYTPGVLVRTPEPGAMKPRLKLMNNGEIRILGADSAAALFAPQNPLQPIAQGRDSMGIGRPWDYPVGINTWVRPRSAQPIGFPTLKALADGYDVLRGLIERVKDKMVTAPWAILPKDRRAKRDSRCDVIQEFLQSPDRMNTWTDWARMLIEQVIVYDAPAIYLRRKMNNQLFAMEIIDGSLIAPKIMADGRLPPPDVGPAYQQVLKGLPAVDYVRPVPFGQPIPRDPSGQEFPELLYKPRNPRVDSVYGFSPVEQMITTINIALRREAYLLNYYTDGSTPDMIFTCPADWTSTEIADFKVWWDSVLSGNLANRRGTMFVPDGATPIDTKEKALTDQTDEWLIRVMCFFMGLNPMPFLKQMNKGQEKTHHDEAAKEGLGPWQHWFTDLFNVVIPAMWGYTDLEFRWEEEESTNPLEQATIDGILVDKKIYHPDELRAKRGDDAMPDDMRMEMDLATFSATPNATILPDEQQAAKDDAAQALAAAKPAPVVAPQKPAAKSETHHHTHVAAPNISIAPPSVNIAPAAIHVSTPPVNVTLPEMKASDVFVDVGATNVKVEAPSAPTKTEKGTPVRKVEVTRAPDGSMKGQIWEGTLRDVEMSAPDKRG